MIKRLLFTYLFLFVLTHVATAQYTLRGTVKDVDSKETIPFVNVYLKHHPTVGIMSDVDGKYRFEVPEGLSGDTLLVASFVGYKPFAIHYKKGKNSIINIDLIPDVQELEEVLVKPGENPAYPIVRSAVKFKKTHRLTELKGYRSQSYNRTDVYLTNSKGIGNAKVLQNARDLIKKQNADGQLSADNGEVLIPVIVSESISEMNVRNTPLARKEVVKSKKISALGMSPDDNLSMLLTGNGFRSYDFMQNRVQIVDKFFPSPIGDGWRVNYEFWLIDSVDIKGDICYQLEVEPRATGDILFSGTVWITKQEGALKKFDLKLDSNANINFVNSIHLMQEFTSTRTGYWYPYITRNTVDLTLDSDLFPGVLLNFLVKTDSVDTNPKFEENLFSEQFTLEENNIVNDEEYWKTHRQEAISQVTVDDSLPQINIYELIDTLQSQPDMKRATTAINVLANGYYETGKIEHGHYLHMLAYNNIETARIGYGIRTNRDFHKKWMFKTNLSYSLSDAKKWKGDFEVNYMINYGSYFRVGFKYENDLRSLSKSVQDLEYDALDLTLERWFNLQARNPYYLERYKVWVQGKVSQNLMTTFTLRKNKIQSGLYLNNIDLPKGHPFPIVPQHNPIDYYESELSVRLAKREKAYINRSNNYKIINPQESPEITLNATFGVIDSLGAAFRPYQKLELRMSQRQGPMFGFGTGIYRTRIAYVFNELPYQLLYVHQGNNTLFRMSGAHQMLNNFEFVSDYFGELQYEHFFNGLLINRIPGVTHINNYLDLRLVGICNVLWGGMTDKNLAYNQIERPDGVVEYPFAVLDPAKPYVEVGFGVENILKFFRLDIMRRVTYTQMPYRTQNITIKGSFNFKF